MWITGLDSAVDNCLFIARNKEDLIAVIVGVFVKQTKREDGIYKTRQNHIRPHKKGLLVG